MPKEVDEQGSTCSQRANRGGLGSLVLRSACAIGAIWLLANLLSTFSIIVPPSRTPFAISPDSVGVLHLIASFSGPAPADACVLDTLNFPPQTPLGVEADRAFKTETMCLSVYEASLSSFLTAAKPVSQEVDLRSLKEYLQQTWVQSPFRQHKASIERPIPAVFHTQPGDSLDSSWTTLNPQVELARTTFDIPLTPEASLIDQKQIKQAPGTEDDLEAPSRATASLRAHLDAVSSLDVQRFSKLFHIGGLWVQGDLRCLTPMKSWTRFAGIEAGGDGPWAGGRAQHPGWRQMGARGEPSVVVFIAEQADDRERDWQNRLPRPVMFSDELMGCSAYHPILLDAIRRSSDSSPAAFTDAILQYLTTMTEGHFHWTELRKIQPEGLRVGDVLILSRDTYHKYVAR